MSMEGYKYNPALRRLRQEHKFKVNLSCLTDRVNNENEKHCREYAVTFSAKHTGIKLSEC